MAAYTFRSAGAVDYDTSASNALTPGAPAGKVSGDLLLLYAATRATGQTMTSLAPDWTQLAFDNADAVSFYVWGRVADGTAADTPTVQFTGTTADAAAWIESRYGDVYTDLSTIVAHIDSSGNQANEVQVFRLPTLTVTTDNTLLIGFSVRLKTNLSDDCTIITAAGGLTKRFSYIQAGNNAMMLFSGSLQQTTAANYDGSDATRNGTDDNSSSTGMVMALRTQVAATVTPNPFHGKLA